MTERADGLEVDTLTIRIPVRLQRRGGRKLIMTAGGGSGDADAEMPWPPARYADDPWQLSSTGCQA
jgi:hypothetical protein